MKIILVFEDENHMAAWRMHIENLRLEHNVNNPAVEFIETRTEAQCLDSFEKEKHGKDVCLIIVSFKLWLKGNGVDCVAKLRKAGYHGKIIAAFAFYPPAESFWSGYDPRDEIDLEEIRYRFVEGGADYLLPISASSLSDREFLDILRAVKVFPV